VTTVLDLIEDACKGTATIRFLPDAPEARPMSDVWAASETAARSIRAHAGADGAVAALLTTSFPCLTSILGAWRSGTSLGSLPLPGRGADVEEYGRQVHRMCTMLGATTLLIDAAYVSLLPELPGITTLTYDDVLAGGPPCDVDREGVLVQFTSGSTGNPKGVYLTLDRIAANITSIIDVAVGDGDVTCSWLPLSHDMGLIGTVLAAISAMPDRMRELVLITPEAFMANPSIWLKSCSRFGATATSAPNFAFDLAARTAKWSKGLDLSPMRICITGAERVRASTLRTFAAAFEGAGLDPAAISPAYGLAEATLAVTMVPRGEAWTSRTVDTALLADGGWKEVVDDEATELVSNGPVIPGMQVRVQALPGEVGEIEINGPSLLHHYVGAEVSFTDDGWLPTRDLGQIVDGELFVVGRTDDMIVVGGRNIYASDVEGALSTVAGVRAGTCAVVPSDDGRYVIVAEPRSNGGGETALDERCKALKTEASRRIGVSASSVMLVAPGSIPKTPSGKLQRHRVRAGLAAGTFEVLARVDFGRRARD
jgi:acyl-CoA synthetase (AMP-forming)/AMP-acid ligase II